MACCSPTASPTGPPRRPASRRPRTGSGSSRSKRDRQGWKVVRPSPCARRITAYTPIEIQGPAAGHTLLKTSGDPSGTRVLGTLNNCAMGFTRGGPTSPARRTSTGTSARRTQRPARGALRDRRDQPDTWWHTTDTRFNLDIEPNEANRFGWVTEIDPFEPGLDAGEAHRAGSAEARRSVGRGDRRRARRGVHGRRRALRVHLPLRLRRALEARRCAEVMHPLDDGILYVARFNADGTGDWLPLTTDNPALAGFASLADILINTRRGRRRRWRHEDGPAGVDRRHRPQEGGVRHPHEQRPSRRRRRTLAWTPPTPAPPTCTATSCGGATRRTSATRSSTGRSSPWPATRPSPPRDRR